MCVNYKTNKIKTMTTYKNRTVLSFVCYTCKKKVHPGETMVTEYADNNGKVRTVLEAFNLLKFGETCKSYHYCASCKN